MASIGFVVDESYIPVVLTNNLINGFSGGIY